MQTTYHIRKAAVADIPAVTRIYDEIHSVEEAGGQTIGWIRGVYPTAATAEAAVERDDLFVLEADDILGAAIINQIQVDCYSGAPWEYGAAEDEVCVLHTLVISPSAGKRGCGREFVRFYEDYARAHGCAELRMDTNARNERARAMYAKLGYREIGIVPTVFNGIPNVDLVLLEKNLNEIRLGRYRHFKGSEYEVLHLAKHSETQEPMVVYRALYGEHGVWVRPASMWNETVERDGRTYRRFTYIGKQEG